MRSGLYFHTHLGLASVAGLADLARLSASHGWDGFFIWDHIVQGDSPVVDSQIALGAIAYATQGCDLKIGALITPLARRRPWKVAKELATLEAVAPGRVVAGVGIGVDADFRLASSEPSDLGTRARILEHNLDLTQRLLAGDTSWKPTGSSAEIGRAVPAWVSLDASLSPLPSVRIPVWGSAVIQRGEGVPQSKAPFRRAGSLMDGIFPVVKRDGEFDVDACLTPSEVEQVKTWTVEGSGRPLPEDFDLVLSGRAFAAGADIRLTELEDAGATWWLEAAPLDAGVEQARELILRGPPTK